MLLWTCMVWHYPNTKCGQLANSFLCRYAIYYHLFCRLLVMYVQSSFYVAFKNSQNILSQQFFGIYFYWNIYYCKWSLEAYYFNFSQYDIHVFKRYKLKVDVPKNLWISNTTISVFSEGFCAICRHKVLKILLKNKIE